MNKLVLKSRIEHIQSIINSIEFQINRIDPEFTGRREFYSGEKEDFVTIASITAWRKRLDFEQDADVYFEISMTDWVKIGLEILDLE